MNTDDNPLPGYDFKTGTLLLVNKPLGWTSFDVVNKIRYKIKHRLGVKKIKVGHAGTLDPMASGLLIICTGKSTKKLHELQGLTKEYTGTLTLGGTTPSYDMETEIEHIFPTDHITLELLEQARQQFIGELDQIPPMFSAIKVDGQPLYKMAREGKKIEVKPRPVHISNFELSNIDLPNIDFKVNCSKGTYIRSLVHDFGKALRSGAYLSVLCRTKIGHFHLEDSWQLEDLVALIENSEQVVES